MNDLDSWKLITWNVEESLILLIAGWCKNAAHRVKKLALALHRFTFGSFTEELVFEDEKAFLNYGRFRSYQLVARFVILWHVLLFVLSTKRQTIVSRVEFAVGFLYLTVKSEYMKKLIPPNLIRYFFAGEFFVYITIYAYHNIDDPISCVLNNTILMIGTGTVTSNIVSNLLVTITATILNQLSFTEVERKNNDLAKLVALYMFVLIDSRIRRKSTFDFVNDSMLRKKSTQKDMNTTMFVASITHDLKNPLNSILGCIEELKASPNITPAEKHNLVTASYSVEIMLYLIGNIHDISKISCGKFEIDRFPMNIEKEVKKVRRIESELIKLKGIKLYCKFLKPLPQYVYGDPMRFEQILINLLGNSIKFTNKGYVAILLNWVKNLNEIKDEEEFLPPDDFFTEERFRSNKTLDTENYYDTLEHIEHGAIGNQMLKYSTLSYLIKQSRNGFTPFHNSSLDFRTRENVLNEEKSDSDYMSEPEEIPLKRQESRDSGLLVVDIIDTGIGMSPEGIARLFQPFSQANKDIRKQFGGTGLGLWITRKLVTAMNGYIEVKSEPKAGSRFRVAIPFTVCMTEELHSDSETSEKEERKSPYTPHRIRSGKRIQCKGKGKMLKEMKLLVLEDNIIQDDRKLEQFYRLVAKDSCEVVYSSYIDAIEAKKLDFSYYDIIFVIASTVTASTKTVITQLFKYVMEHEMKPIPLCVATGTLRLLEIDIAAQGEFAALTDFVITYPLEESALLKLLMRAGMRSDKRTFISEDYRKLINELGKNYDVKVYDPEKVKKILMADDDVTSLSILKNMIEKTGDYKIFSFYNGLDVLRTLA